MEDREIIKLFESRDERAIAETAEKYDSYCRSIGMNILHSSEDCEECLNDALLKLWERIPPEKPADLGAYLAAAMRNSALSRYRRQNAQKRTADNVACALDELAEVAADAENVEGSVEARELMKAVNEFLYGLPKQKRMLFVRRYFYLDSLADAAKRLGLSENRAAVMLFRIRKKLAEYLKKEGLV